MDVWAGAICFGQKPLQENFKVMDEQIEKFKDDIEEIKHKQKEVDRNFSNKLNVILRVVSVIATLIC